MCGVPTIVPKVGCRALIAPVSYVQWLLEAVGGLSIDSAKNGVKRLFCGRNFLALPPPFPLRIYAVTPLGPTSTEW